MLKYTFHERIGTVLVAGDSLGTHLGRLLWRIGGIGGCLESIACVSERYVGDSWPSWRGWGASRWLLGSDWGLLLFHGAFGPGSTAARG